MSDEPLPMMQGKFEPLKKMSKAHMMIEIEAWRNLWSYMPSEVKGNQQPFVCQLDSLWEPSPRAADLTAGFPLNTIY